MKTDSDTRKNKDNNYQQNKNNQQTKIARKTTVWAFQATNKRNLIRETWTFVRNRHFKQETESLLLAAQNNAIRTNYVKENIQDTAR